jgi:hypothetical protein
VILGLPAREVIATMPALEERKELLRRAQSCSTQSLERRAARLGDYVPRGAPGLGVPAYLPTAVPRLGDRWLLI